MKIKYSIYPYLAFVSILSLLFVSSIDILPSSWVQRTGSTSVAILVVDDFQPATREHLIDPTKEYGDQNCVINPEGQGRYSAGGLGRYSAGGLSYPNKYQSHGELVFHQLEYYLDNIRGGKQLREERKNAPISGFRSWEFSQGIVYLVGVDTNEYTTQSVKANIEKVIAQDIAENYVINMSFGIIPCEPLGYYDYMDMLKEAVHDGSLSGLPGVQDMLEELLHGLEILSPDEQRSELFSQDYTQFRMILEYANVSAQFPEFVSGISLAEEQIKLWEKFEAFPFRPRGSEIADPLYQWINNPGVGGDYATAISIASSGNSGPLPYPFAPAMWSAVLSVSALNADYSNSGEITVSGTHPTEKMDSREPITGTSFAAPRVSLVTAMYLLFGGDAKCSGYDGDSHPPMAYAPTKDDWRNLEMREAAGLYCNEIESAVRTFLQD